MSSIEVWLQTQTDGSGSSSKKGTTVLLANGMSLINHREQKQPERRAYCSRFRRSMKPTFSARNGGSSAMGRTKHIEPRNRMSPTFVRVDCSLFSCRFPTLLLLSPLGISAMASASVAADDLTTTAGRRLLCLLVSVEALLEGAYTYDDDDTVGATCTRELGWIKAGLNASAGAAASRTAKAVAAAAEVPEQPTLMVAWYGSRRGGWAGCMRMLCD